MKLFKSIKIRLINYYYYLCGSKDIHIDDLIYPSRDDINLRVDFINNYILKHSNKFEDSAYYKFLVNLNKHPHYIMHIDIKHMIEKFIKLYFLIKKNGYQPEKYGYLSVEKVNHKMRFVYPAEGQIIYGEKVNNRYILYEGAHRLAVLKVLNYSKVKCKRVYLGRIAASDYSSFIKNYQND